MTKLRLSDKHIYIGLSLLAIFAVPLAHHWMIIQQAIAWIHISQVTLNFAIFLLIYGYGVDSIAKRKKFKGVKWIMFWFVAMAILMVVLHYGGMRTIFET